MPASLSIQQMQIALQAEIQALADRVQHLEDRLLEDRLAQQGLPNDSHSSSKPPSGDGFRRTSKSLR